MPKLLGELLQEQQEPFVLEVYLLERGYVRSFDARSSSGNLAKSLNSSASCTLKKRWHSVPYCPKFLRSVVSQLGIANDNHKLKNPGHGGWKKPLMEKRKGSLKDAAKDRFSSASSTTMFNSSSESNVEEAHCLENDGKVFIEKEVVADGKLKWRAVEDSKQLSPISVLQETESDEGSPVNDEQSNKTAQRESSTSISQRKLQQSTRYGVQELQEIVSSNSYAQYIINKRALKQTKQLLVDNLGDLMESHRKGSESREQVKNILGADELRKLVHENVWLWSREPIDETNIVHQLHFNFLASAEEWSDDSEQQKMEISTDIGDAILEDIAKEISNMLAWWHNVGTSQLLV